jgi:DNA-binding NarL/FixJ family response regulator
MSCGTCAESHPGRPGCLPIVVLTTSDAERDAGRGYEYRANGFVSKPVDVQRLSELIEGLGCGLSRRPDGRTS